MAITLGNDSSASDGAVVAGTAASGQRPDDDGARFPSAPESGVLGSESDSPAVGFPELATDGISGELDEVAEYEEGEGEDFEAAEEEVSWFDNETFAMATSLLAHLAVVLALALIPLAADREEEAVVLVSAPPDYEEHDIQQIEEIVYSDQAQTEVGANSLADTEMAMASAATFAEVAEIPNPIDQTPQELATLNVNTMFSEPVAPLDLNIQVKGKVGHAAEGAAGAVDRLTFEIVKNLEERPTLVVWLFDQSGSLLRQRQEIRDRFDRVYAELGIIEASDDEAFAKRGDEPPLLTSIMGFGEKVQLLTAEPTADLQEIKAVVDGIENDPKGIERVFSAVYAAANEYKDLRRGRGRLGPKRNVMLVVVTDERGDDSAGLEQTTEICKKYGMPVYVIGVPAPFGRETTLIKYVDPDENFDQTPKFGEVDQGPESLMPERVKIGYIGDFDQEPVIDSGFGPFALTRLAYETGGIFFTVHPNRNVNRRVSRDELTPFASSLEYFFDPNVMARYRPDYVSVKDYQQRVRSNPLRAALVTAGQAPELATLERPRTRFVKRDEAQLAGELGRAQQAAARIEPRLIALDDLLAKGEAGREAEYSPRWLAGFDLARGRVLAHKVRAETYNAMLAKAKRGMPFSDPKNNTWVLRPADEVSVGSKWEREATAARQLLESVTADHAGTPWALLAKEELKTPIGWRWEEEYTDLNPPPARNPGNNNNNMAPAQDDPINRIERKPTRPVPKL
ncbi:vWA domain-containing protein [Planctomycetaceae bacterium SH139]